MSAHTAVPAAGFGFTEDVRVRCVNRIRPRNRYDGRVRYRASLLAVLAFGLGCSRSGQRHGTSLPPTRNAASASLQSGVAEQPVLIGDEVLDCEVVEVSENFAGYVPPRLGDRITLDLADERLELIFSERRMIPTTALERRRTAVQSKGHQAFYEEVLDETNGTRQQLIVGAYGDGNAPLHERSWSARFQRAEFPPFSSWKIEHLNLACRLEAEP